MRCASCGDMFFDGTGADVCEACQSLPTNWQTDEPVQNARCEACGDRLNDGSGSDVCADCKANEINLPPWELSGYYGTYIA